MVICIFKSILVGIYQRSLENPNLKCLKKGLGKMFEFSLTGDSNYIFPIENY